MASPIIDQRGITSGMAHCVRKGCYAALGSERDELPFEVGVYLRRGQVFEQLRINEWREAFPGEIEHSRPIPWEAAGMVFHGQADGYHSATKRIIEIVSTVSPSPKTLALKIDQAKTYAVLDPEAERACVDVIDPSKLVAVDTIPIRIRDDDIEEVRGKVAAVAAALKSGGADLPERVCQKPSDARGYMCPFASTCFEGWEEPDAVELDSEDAVQLAGEMLSVGAELAAKKAAVKEAELRLEELRREAVEIIPVGLSQIGDVAVLRTVVKGKTTFSYANAVKAGAVDPQAVEAFVKIGKPHERWTVKKVPAGGEIREVDLGADIGWEGE